MVRLALLLPVFWGVRLETDIVKLVKRVIEEGFLAEIISWFMLNIV